MQTRTTTTTTTRTVAGSSKLAVHKISFRGLAGAIFVAICVAILLYIIGFATNGWSISGNNHLGLWESCSCSKTVGSLWVDDKFKAVQAMITIGLIGLIVAFVLACLYMTIHTISKNTTIIAFTSCCFASVLFMLIGFIIWGATQTNLNYSFALSVIAAILTLVAGILGVLQMRQSNVHI